MEVMKERGVMRGRREGNKRRGRRWEGGGGGEEKEVGRRRRGRRRRGRRRWRSGNESHIHVHNKILS